MATYSVTVCDLCRQPPSEGQQLLRFMVPLCDPETGGHFANRGVYDRRVEACLRCLRQRFAIRLVEHVLALELVTRDEELQRATGGNVRVGRTYGEAHPEECADPR